MLYLIVQVHQTGAYFVRVPTVNKVQPFFSRVSIIEVDHAGEVMRERWLETRAHIGVHLLTEVGVTFS